jgi:dTDP-4-dehydrorhamnose 3,5-epimerase
MKKVDPGQSLEGVVVTPKRKIFDDRGAIFHMLRSDDPEFQKFGEIYFSQIYPGVVKAWHFHEEMQLNYYLLSGAIRMVLFDDREGSSTRGLFQEIYLHPEDPKLVTVPVRVWNGFKGLGTTPSIVANCATLAHKKDEISYKPHDDPMFGYDWSQRNG